MRIKSTAIIDTIKPTVPQTRIGGNDFTVSNPQEVNDVYATELDNAIVGI